MQGMETPADTPNPDANPDAEGVTETEATAAADTDIDAELDQADVIDLELSDATEDRIDELEAENADLKDKLLRALAEAENVRRRAERDKTDAQRYAVTKFARELLSVADNLGRALQSADEEARKSSEALQNLWVGVEMTEKELRSAFDRAGIKTLNPEGQAFDHHAHEALFEIEDPSKPAGTVLQVIELGYMLNDRLLRPAKVGVAKGGPKSEAKPADAAQADGAADAGATAGQKTYEQNSDQAKGSPGGSIDEEL